MRNNLTPRSNILITGVTGLIGGEVFRRLLGRGHEGAIWALVRPTADRGPDERVRDRLSRSGDRGLPNSKVSPVAGDILDPGWGLSAADRDAIAPDVDLIIHNAADTSFAAHRNTARTNVESVRHLIDFARTCRRRPLIAYMSTASNVGEVNGKCLDEDDGCRPENDHFNEYTQSKAAGEQLLRSSGLQVLTLRPSIVLSAGLQDPTFARQILWCVPLTRIFRALPVDPDSRLDLVDVGFVADATVRLLEAVNRKHDCYHISAGRSASIAVQEIADLIGQHYDRATQLHLVTPASWSRAFQREYVRTATQRRVFRSLRYYLPFLNMDVVYNDARLREVVPTTDVPVRPVTTYLKPLLRLIRTKAALREAAVP